MIKTITVINYLGEQIKISLSEMHPSHGLVISDISGLGPAKGNISSTSLSNGDGSVYNLARLDERNIVIKIIFDPDSNIETTRQLTYKYFPVKKQIMLKIDTDNRSAYAIGYIESNEPTIFDEMESCQISIICPDPFFYSNEIIETWFYGIEPGFEFPFSNESLSEKLIEFSSIMNRKARSIYYNGDDEIGITINIHTLGPVGDIVIWDINTKQKITVYADKLKKVTGSSLINGDDIIINSEKGNRYIRLLRAGHYTNIINCIDRYSNWFMLTKGENIFSFEATTGQDNILFRIENRNLYEGV